MGYFTPSMQKVISLWVAKVPQSFALTFAKTQIVILGSTLLYSRKAKGSLGLHSLFSWHRYGSGGSDRRYDYQYLTDRYQLAVSIEDEHG